MPPALLWPSGMLCHPHCYLLSATNWPLWSSLPIWQSSLNLPLSACHLSVCFTIQWATLSHRLCQHLPILPIQMGTIARITKISQYKGVTLQMPINSILKHNDILLLLAMILVPGCSPLVTQFLIHQEMTFHLWIVVLLDYEYGQLWFLSKPSTPEMEPASETLSISLATMANYHFRVAFLHEDSVSDAWILRQLQLTSLSTPVLIQIDAVIGQASFVCLGPEDPYENTSRQADALQYWLPAGLLGNTTHFQQLMTLSVQVSQCLVWAFPTCGHTIWYQVTEILS